MISLDINSIEFETSDRAFDSSVELKDNAMLKTYPELFNEWNFSLNDKLGYNIYKITCGSTGYKVWWTCKDCKSNFAMVVHNKGNRKQKCPYCLGIYVNHTNSLAVKEPEVAKEWHPTLNEDLTPYDVTCGLAKKVWWLCTGCESSYDSSIIQRAGGRKRGCPFCSGSRVNKTNSLASLNPILASEWHPVLNGEVTPENVTSRSNKKVWWVSRDGCGHTWDAQISNRNFNSRGCPYCAKSNARLLVGFNDMWTTDPNQAKMLANQKDGYRYTKSSTKKVDWKCPHCGSMINNRSINAVNKNRLCCAKCDDDVSYGEKMMFSLLGYWNIDFICETSLNWSQGKRYDFYIPSLDMIIEIHGEQHYIETGRNGSRNLIDEQKNDELKNRMAVENGIDNYIVIDARKSDYEWIMNSIKTSNLILFFDISDENLDGFTFDPSSSKIRNVWNLWRTGTTDILNLVDITKLHRSTVNRYLKMGNDLGLI